MSLADNQQQRLLERLRQAGEQPIDFAELHAGGVDFPAVVVCELELNGHAIERVYDNGRLVDVRLVGPEPPEAPAAHRRRPWPTGSQPLYTPRSRRSPDYESVRAEP